MSKKSLPVLPRRIRGGGSGINISLSSFTDFAILFILISLFAMVVYLFYINVVQNNTLSSYYTSTSTSSPIIISTTSNLDKINDPYTPPLKKNSWLPSSWFYSAPSPHYDATSSTILMGEGHTTIPVIQPPPHQAINIRTRGIEMPFEQVGFLKSGENILPLMGRSIDNGRDKSQYYTVSNSGTINTKLPVKVKGRECSGEYGCDSVYDGDNIFVEGLDREFTAKIYENAPLMYI